jgi:hypothetical protein
MHSSLVLMRERPATTHRRGWMSSSLGPTLILEQRIFYATNVLANIIIVMWSISLWSIWHSRNRWKHDQEFTDPVQSLKMSREALILLEIPRRQVVMSGHGWRLPDTDVCKSMRMERSTLLMAREVQAVSLGLHASLLALGISPKPLHGITDPLIAESLAVRGGVLSRACHHREVVNLSNHHHNSRSIVAPLLVEIRELAISFSSFEIQHVIGTSNYPAHLCAKRCEHSECDRELDGRDP